MFEFCNFLWNKFIALTGWQMVLWVVYLIYFVARTYAYWEAASDKGVWKGYRYVLIGKDTHLRLFHIIWGIIDVPMAAIGLFLPIITHTLTFKIYQFKKQ